MMHDYFRSVLGTDQSDLGAGDLTPCGEMWKNQSPWVAVSDSYAEYVRSGAINVTIGRVTAVKHSTSSSPLAKLEVRQADGKLTTMEDVAAIVLATGFTPFDSLSFLPADVLSKLEYSPDDPFLPVILDGKACINADVPDVGFVGLYRGPYWGVMEMQARRLAQVWARSDTATYLSPEEIRQNEKERQLLRDLRRGGAVAGSNPRSQFPMGDYVGLMESFARDLGISRFELPGYERRSGPVVPARYTLLAFQTEARQMSEAETAITLDSLRAVLGDESGSFARRSVSRAIFRTLHGTWRFSRTIRARKSDDDLLHPDESASQEEEASCMSGTATFHPRYPSDPDYESEYLYDEEVEFENADANTIPISRSRTRTRSVFRLRQDAAPANDDLHIGIWSVDAEKDPNAAASFSHGLELDLDYDTLSRSRDRQTQSQPKAHPPEKGGEEEKEKAATAVTERYTYTYRASGASHSLGGVDKCESDDEYEYVFHMRGVGITAWEIIEREKKKKKKKIDEDDKRAHDRSHSKSNSNSNRPDGCGGVQTRYRYWSRTRYER